MTQRRNSISSKYKLAALCASYLSPARQAASVLPACSSSSSSRRAFRPLEQCTDTQITEKFLFINLFILLLLSIDPYLSRVHGVLRRRLHAVLAAALHGGDGLPRRLRRLRLRRHACDAAVDVGGQLHTLPPQGGLLRPQEAAAHRRRAAAALDEQQGEQRRECGAPDDVAASVDARVRSRREGPLGAAEADEAERRHGGGGRHRERGAGDDGAAAEGGAREGGGRAPSPHAGGAAAPVALRQRPHGEGHGARHLRRREQVVLHVAAGGGAAEHPGGEADRGAAAAAEAEAGPTAAPPAPASGVVGAALQAARRRRRGPRWRPRRGNHQRAPGRRRGGRRGVASRGRALLRRRRRRDRSHHQHLIRHGRRDERHAGRAGADDPAGGGVPGGSDAAVEHRHRLADAGGEPPGKPDPGEAEGSPGAGAGRRPTGVRRFRLVFLNGPDMNRSRVQLLTHYKLRKLIMAQDLCSSRSDSTRDYLSENKLSGS